MFLFVIGIIVVLASIFGGISVRSVLKRENETQYMTTTNIVSAVVAIVGVVLILLSCAKSIPAGHTGVVTTFGQVQNYTLDSGLNFQPPWNRIIKMDNRVQKQTVNLMSFSSDIQEVSIAYTVNYQISKADAMTIYSSIGTDYYNVIIAPNIAESVKVVTARYTAEQLVGKRDTLAMEIEDILSDRLAEYNILLVNTSIEDMDFTDAFTNAVEEKQVAQQKKLKAQTEQEQLTMEKQAQAERDVIAAQAALEVSKIEAEAVEYAGQKEAAANKAISESITPTLIEYYKIQQWNGALPTITGNDSIISMSGIN